MSQENENTNKSNSQNELIMKSDPNLALFTDDKERAKAYKWYCIKTTILKGIATISLVFSSLSILLKSISTFFC